MQLISPAWAAAIATGYRMYLEVNILERLTGLPVATGLAVSDGQVVVDRTAAQRRTCSVTLTPDSSDLVPVDVTSPLMPVGAFEIQILAGWIDPVTQQPYVIPSTGMVELISMGIYVLTDAAFAELGVDLQITLTGYDRSWLIDQFLLMSAYNITAGTTVQAAIQGLMDAAIGAYALKASPPDYANFALPAMSFTQGAGPWAACLTVGAAAGMEVFFDAVGVPTALPIPDPSQVPPSWAFVDDGSVPIAGATRQFSTATMNLSRRGVSNYFVVSGTGSQVSPVSAYAADSNPLSPTYYEGPYGAIPAFATASSITTAAQALAAAQNAVYAAVGAFEQYTITTVPMPMFDIDDVLTLVATRLKTSQRIVPGLPDFRVVIDSATVSLRHDTKTELTGRKVYPQP